jgi:Family of unknown function (DUF6239)
VHDHDHTPVFAATTGSQWLWVVLLAGVVVVAASALIRPVVPELVATARLPVALTAGAVGLVLLLLVPATTLPHQVVGLLVVALVVPVVGSRPGLRHRPWIAARTAPWTVAVAAGASGGHLIAAWAGAGPGAVHAAMLLGLVGLSWSVLCKPRSRTSTAAVHATGWLMGTAVLGATTIAATAALH